MADDVTWDGEPGKPDGTEYPFVEDLDGVWHMRPPADVWKAGMDAPNAQGLCGPVHSVHASAYAPDEHEPLCPTCKPHIEAAQGYEQPAEQVTAENDYCRTQPGCCSTCGGKGKGGPEDDGSGCHDCYGTGHLHLGPCTLTPEAPSG